MCTAKTAAGVALQNMGRSRSDNMYRLISAGVRVQLQLFQQSQTSNASPPIRHDIELVLD